MQCSPNNQDFDRLIISTMYIHLGRRLDVLISVALLEHPSEGSSTGWPALESGDAGSCYSVVSQVGYWMDSVVVVFTRLTI